jgi:hypothetical protein
MERVREGISALIEADKRPCFFSIGANLRFGKVDFVNGTVYNPSCRPSSPALLPGREKGEGHRTPIILSLTLLIAGLYGCQKGPVSPSRNGTVSAAPAVATAPARAEASPAADGLTPPGPDSVTFVDITQQAGIRWKHFSGARGKKYMPECETPGCAFFDYNNDGKPDILLLNGADWPEVKQNRMNSRTALYRNDGSGKYTDVSRGSGLDIEMHTMGVAVGDYDNDGWDDLYITCVLGPSRLFHNERNGRFKEVTQQAGVHNEGKWGSAAAWLDYDKDGRLDLVAGNYCKWTPETDVFCTVYRGKKSYCTPNVYDGDSLRLYHNEGNGKFKDVSQQAGVTYAPGKTWGIAILDFDNDGWMDIAVANDMEPNCLFHNQRDGTFKEVAMTVGIALSESGNAKAGMGIDAADIDNSGRESILISNFSGEGVSLFHNADGQLFYERSGKAGMAESSLLKMGWGLFFFDYDLDGRKDALVCNGHLYDNVNMFQPDVYFAERPLLYHNRGGLNFAEVASQKGDLSKRQVARGCSYADIDGDGDLDVLIMAMDGAPRLLRNDGGNKNRWLRVRLIGKKSNRNGYGAKVEVTVRGLTQMARVRSGSSFLSALEQTATFGLGQQVKAEQVKITWPSGQVDTYRDVPANTLLTATEGESIPPR